MEAGPGARSACSACSPRCVPLLWLVEPLWPPSDRLPQDFDAEEQEQIEEEHESGECISCGLCMGHSLLVERGIRCCEHRAGCVAQMRR